ncbi:VOC family protein [Lacinutrix jangbogonensis]|uniref:VOC family protein n=1 Tax=Lacinutrix jangbogonensis TaxID=1469557 RepID=UPI000A57B4CD|nr:VOC family protein [Lacinutrix jangbogonensis]
MIIKGLFETHLYVEDLERSIDFYGHTLALKQCRFDAERRAAFFWIGEDKQAMLGLWEKPKNEIDKRHFAFQCEPEWILTESVNYLKKRNLHFWNFLSDDTERPMVFAWVPAIAIYFTDPDGHYLEFIGILNGKSKSENGVISYQEWEALELKEK